MRQELKLLEEKIKKNEGLDTAGKSLERIVNNSSNDEERSYGLYLYGMVLQKKGLVDQAIKALEEAVGLDNSLAECFFLLAPIYLQKKNLAKVFESLATCISLDYKTKYCCRLQIKTAYQVKDYIAVNNFISEYDNVLPSKRLADILRIECLQRLKLSVEANRLYQDLAGRIKSRSALKQWLEQLLTEKEQTKYEERYLLNQAFFQQRGVSFPDYNQVQYKASRFLSEEYVYDRDAGRFLLAIQEPRPESYRLEVASDDVLIIHNTDNVKVFESLQQILDEIASDAYHKKVGSIPVLVVEEYRENWELIMQLYDFNLLNQWHNLHFYIGISKEELRTLFSNEATPLPNLFYGAQLEPLQEMLLELKVKRDEVYIERLDNLKDYYTRQKIGSFQKILIFTSIYNDSLLCYGQMLQAYLAGNGYTCQLYHEPAPFNKFNYYDDVKVVNEFRPDMVIHLFSLPEESEVFKGLNLPYINWFIFNKNVNREIISRLVLTGNRQKYEPLLNGVEAVEKIAWVPLPVSQYSGKGRPASPVNDIGIIADLDNIDLVFKNMITLVNNRLIAKQMITREELTSIFKAVYFEVYIEQINQNFVRPELPVYQKIIQQNFAKRNINFDELSLVFIADLFKRELESSLFKLIQIRWLLDTMQDNGLEIYGAGWEHDPDLKPFSERQVDFLNDLSDYRRVVLRSKVNLYIGNRLNNSSYMQPDLINGLALGGFFLVNDLLVKEFGESVLEPFGGLLVTYGSRAEMIEKLKYYLEHDQERDKQAKQLQAHIRNNFQIEKVAETILAKAKESRKDNLH